MTTYLPLVKSLFIYEQWKVPWTMWEMVLCTRRYPYPYPNSTGRMRIVTRSLQSYRETIETDVGHGILSKDWNDIARMRSHTNTPFYCLTHFYWLQFYSFLGFHDFENYAFSHRLLAWQFVDGLNNFHIGSPFASQVFGTGIINAVLLDSSVPS